jgi:hypothetical protein
LGSVLSTPFQGFVKATLPGNSPGEIFCFPYGYRMVPDKIPCSSNNNSAGNLPGKKPEGKTSPR